MYAEMTYFEGYHFKHLADWQEQQRLERKRTEAIRMLDRRQHRR